jgi:hypothetical protein
MSLLYSIPMETTLQKPALLNLDEFRKERELYRPSEESLRIFRATGYCALNGVSGSGRNTILKELLKTGQYHWMISDTTRQPRLNDGVMERNGVEYWFKTEQQFLEGIRQGKYLEFEILHNDRPR